MLVRCPASYKAPLDRPLRGSRTSGTAPAVTVSQSWRVLGGSMKFVRQSRRFGVISEPNVKPLAAATLFNAAGNNVYGVALGGGWPTRRPGRPWPSGLSSGCAR